MLSTKLGTVSQINPRFGTNTLHNLQGHSLHMYISMDMYMDIYPLPDIAFKKTYCIPLFRLFRQNCP